MDRHKGFGCLVSCDNLSAHVAKEETDIFHKGHAFSCFVRLKQLNQLNLHMIGVADLSVAQFIRKVVVKRKQNGKMGSQNDRE